MSAKSNTDSYLCVNIPETGSHLQNDFQKGQVISKIIIFLKEFLN